MGVVTAAGARSDPVDGRLQSPTAGVVDVGDSTVMRTCDVTEPRDHCRFRPAAAPELELPAAAAECLGELKVDERALNGVVGE